MVKGNLDAYYDKSCGNNASNARVWPVRLGQSVGDFNADGKTDLLWRNKANGKVAIWLINGTTILSYDIIGEVSDLNWEINNKKS